MDNYLDKNRFLPYYRIQAAGKADKLRRVAKDAGIRHIKSFNLRDKFNREIETFIQEQMASVNRASNERQCKYVLNNLHQEKTFIDEQDFALKIKKAKIVASAELTNKLDTWGYFINGVGLVIGGGQVIAGAGVLLASSLTGNVSGAFAGATIILHGINNAYESYENLRNNRNDTKGLVREGYMATAKFLGFDSKVGSIAFSSMDLMLSGYGLGRMVTKPDAWRLYRYLPSDFIRNIKTVGAPSLALEALGDSITLKGIYDQR